MRALKSQLPIIATMLATTAFPAVSYAQENNDAAIGDIVSVYDTIRRTDEVPLSVDVLSSDALETINLVHPSEAFNRVAGVNIHRGSGQEHLTAIRSPVLTGGSGAGSFLYLEDGVPLRAAGFANVNGLFEAGTEFAGSVDIIKGPGPATYGSNAVHGLINVRSQDMEPGTGRLSVMGSDDGFYTLKAGAAQSVGSSKVQANMSLTSDDGFRDDSGFDQQKFQLKYNTTLGAAWDAVWLTSFQNLNQETAGFIQGPDAYRDDAVRFTNPNPEAFRDAKSYRTQARLERTLNGHSLALTPYARRAELRFLRHFVPGQALEKNAHTSVGLQTAYYDDVDNQFNIGADVEYTKGSLFEFQHNPNRFSFVQGLHFDYEVDAFVGAVYGQRKASVTNHTTLEVGARAEYTRYQYDNLATDGQSGRFIRTGDRTDNYFTITPKASLSHALNETINIYVRAARGSRAPQVTDLYSAQQNQVPGEADVEILDSLEAGWKLAQNGLVIETAAFTMWKENFFFRNANGFNVVNGKTRHSGIEVSFEWAISLFLGLSGDGTWARHTYNFTEIVGSGANNILDGNRVDTAPDTLAHMRATLTPTDSLMAEIEWRHIGSYFTNPGNSEQYPGHDIFVLRARYELPGGTEIFGRIDNLLDAKYADRADFAFGNERYFPGRPRTFFLGLTHKFK